MEGNLVSSECLQLFVKLSEFVRFIGGHIMDTGEDGPPNKRTYFMYCLLYSYCTMNLTSIHHFRDNFIDLAFALVTFGFAIQGLAKVYVIIGCMKKVRKVIYAARDFVVIFEGNQRVVDLFKKYVKFCNFCRPLVMRFYTIAGTSIIVAPIILTFWTGSKQLPYGTVIPFLDHRSDAGYCLNFVYMMIVTLFAVYGIFGSDYGYLCTMAMACGQAETIGVLCEDLTMYLETNDQQHREREIQKLIANIVVAQQKHSHYMKILEDAFGVHSFAIIVGSMISIAIALFVFIQEIWINGLMVIGIAFWQILIICTVGGIYMIKMNQVEVRVNNTKWYLLPSKKQKMFINIFHNIQNPVIPSALGFAPLNFETFVNCLKTMYQFLMLLINMSN